MLGILTEKMQGVIGKLRGAKTLSEKNIADAVTEVRLALLEADVAYGVVKLLIKRVKEKALGDSVIKSVTPGQMFIKIVHDELVLLMGGEEKPLEIKQKPAIVMMCGLQGSGKTTLCAKLAHYCKKMGMANKVLLAACDLQRPAAIEQLSILADQIAVDLFTLRGENDPIKVARGALESARSEHYDLLIVDTAGRLHIDEELMLQLEQIKSALSPTEILLVANASLGQDAVKVAAEFNKRISISGTALTMLDGNAAGGAAISICEVTGKPLKFEGIGEKIDDLQLFNPQSMADRILGMGDTINLVRKAKEHIDDDAAKNLEKKLRSATFSYEDFLSQMQMMKKLGSLKGLLSMLPGMNAIKELELDEKGFYKNMAMIQSMTSKERASDCELTVARRRRIAGGSGTTLDDVNKLVKMFDRTKKFFKNMPNMKQLEKMMGGASWR